MNVIHMIRRYRRLDEDSDEKPVYFSLWPRWVYVDNVGAVCRDTLSNGNYHTLLLKILQKEQTWHGFVRLSVQRL
jgi:hypothetical protein